MARCAVAGGNPGNRGNAGPEAAERRPGRQCRAEQPGGTRGLEAVETVAIEGQPIDNPNAFDYRFATRPLGGAAQIDVQRGGRTAKLTVPLETAPDTNRDEIVLSARSPFQGAGAANISPAVADELRLDAQTEGVVVIDLEDGATAASVGFQKGDIILAVNNQKIAKTSDLDKASKTPTQLWRITVVRGGQQINVTLGGSQPKSARRPISSPRRGWSTMRRVHCRTGCGRRRWQTSSDRIISSAPMVR